MAVWRVWGGGGESGCGRRGGVRANYSLMSSTQ